MAIVCENRYDQCKYSYILFFEQCGQFYLNIGIRRWLFDISSVEKQVRLMYLNVLFLQVYYVCVNSNFVSFILYLRWKATAYSY